ncbi:hypothetical protein BDM02DRAFT_3273494 [Thelephora ganbajun]|uniref:Uncharacterized protein n=1 Tax=Thelephora ganbajun TaxID=370292 RepID=A0ACB6YYL6_THEGA|nr:hypothetical protein BDM02DRAFT_3273494 [Thelephora ganbajun]
MHHSRTDTETLLSHLQTPTPPSSLEKPRALLHLNLSSEFPHTYISRSIVCSLRQKHTLDTSVLVNVWVLNDAAGTDNGQVQLRDLIKQGVLTRINQVLRSSPPSGTKSESPGNPADPEVDTNRAGAKEYEDDGKQLTLSKQDQKTNFESIRQRCSMVRKTSLSFSSLPTELRLWGVAVVTSTSPMKRRSTRESADSSFRPFTREHVNPTRTNPGMSGRPSLRPKISLNVVEGCR